MPRWRRITTEEAAQLRSKGLTETRNVVVDQDTGDLAEAGDESESKLGFAARSIAGAIPPLLAGRAIGAGAGAVLGGGAGLAGGPAAPATVPAGVTAGIIGGNIVGGLAASGLQEYLLKGAANRWPSSAIADFQRRREGDIQASPYASMLTSLGASPAGGGGLMTIPSTLKRAAQMGGLQFGIDIPLQYATTGEYDPVRGLIAAGSGAFQSTPNRSIRNLERKITSAIPGIRGTSFEEHFAPRMAPEKPQADAIDKVRRSYGQQLRSRLEGEQIPPANVESPGTDKDVLASIAAEGMTVAKPAVPAEPTLAAAQPPPLAPELAGQLADLAAGKRYAIPLSATDTLAAPEGTVITETSKGKILHDKTIKPELIKIWAENDQLGSLYGKPEAASPTVAESSVTKPASPADSVPAAIKAVAPVEPPKEVTAIPPGTRVEIGDETGNHYTVGQTVGDQVEIIQGGKKQTIPVATLESFIRSTGAKVTAPSAAVTYEAPPASTAPKLEIKQAQSEEVIPPVKEITPEEIKADLEATAREAADELGGVGDDVVEPVVPVAPKVKKPRQPRGIVLKQKPAEASPVTSAVEEAPLTTKLPAARPAPGKQSSEEAARILAELEKPGSAAIQGRVTEDTRPKGPTHVLPESVTKVRTPEEQRNFRINTLADRIDDLRPRLAGSTDKVALRNLKKMEKEMATLIAEREAYKNPASIGSGIKAVMEKGKESGAVLNPFTILSERVKNRKLRLSKENTDLLPKLVKDRVDKYVADWANTNYKINSLDFNDSDSVFIRSDAEYNPINLKTGTTGTGPSAGDFHGEKGILPGQRVKLPPGGVVVEQAYRGNGDPYIAVHYNSRDPMFSVAGPAEQGSIGAGMQRAIGAKSESGSIINPGPEIQRAMEAGGAGPAKLPTMADLKAGAKRVIGAPFKAGEYLGIKQLYDMTKGSVQRKLATGHPLEYRHVKKYEQMVVDAAKQAPFKQAMQEMKSELSAAEIDRISDYVYAKKHNEPSDVKPTELEQEHINTAREIIDTTGMQKVMGAYITDFDAKGNQFQRPAIMTEHFFPEAMNSRARKVLNNATRYGDEYNRLRNDFIAFQVSQGRTEEVAGKIFEQLKSIPQVDKKNINMQFRGNRFALGVGLPKSMRMNAIDALDRDISRHFQDYSWHKNIESDPQLAKGLGLEDMGRNDKVPDEVLDDAGNPIESNILQSEDTAAMHKDYLGYSNPGGQMLEKMTSTVASTLVSTWSAVRDTLRLPVFMATHGTIPQNVRLALPTIADAFKKSVKHEAMAAGGLRAKGNAAMTIVDDAEEGIKGILTDGLRTGIHRITATERISSANRQLGFAYGKRLARDNFIKANEKFLEKWGPFEWRKMAAENPEELFDYIGARMAGASGGTYGAEGLPNFALKSGDNKVLQATAPLYRWSIEEFNRWYRDAYTPAKEGNVGPLLRSLTATMALTTPVFNYLKEKITEAKPREMTWAEYLKLGGKEDTAYELFSRIEAAGYAGALGSLAFMAVQTWKGETPHGFGQPAFQLAVDIIERFSQWGQHYRNGEAELGDLATYAGETALQQVQILRMLSQQPPTGEREENIARRVGVLPPESKGDYGVRDPLSMSGAYRSNDAERLAKIFRSRIEKAPMYPTRNPLPRPTSAVRPDPNYYRFIAELQGPEAAEAAYQRDKDETIKKRELFQRAAQEATRR